MVFFGQWVIGPPGAGKSTYCNGMQQICNAINRKVAVVNLDPANDDLPYDCAVDIKDLITVARVAEEFKLGPNGGLIYCMDYLLANLDWLEGKLKEQKDAYILFDCPGQVELSTHHSSMRSILEHLQKKMDARLTAVQLVDSTFCSDPAKYISALLVCLGAQCQLELPHVNVLTKIDLLKHHKNDLDFRIEYYAQAEGLSHLLHVMTAKATHPLDKKFSAFEEALCELVEDYSLISFQLLDIQEKKSVLDVLKAVDSANGFCIGGLPADSSPFNMVLESQYTKGVYEECFGAVQERYIDISDEDDEKGQKLEEDVPQQQDGDR